MDSSGPGDPRQRFAGFESIPIDIVVRVGSATCRLAQLAGMRPGQILRLDRAVGRPLELIAGGMVIARVEPVADEQHVALKVTALVEEDDVGS